LIKRKHKKFFWGSSHALRPHLHTWRIFTIGDPTGSSIQGHTCPISRDAATLLGAHPLAWGRCLYNFAQWI